MGSLVGAYGAHTAMMICKFQLQPGNDMHITIHRAFAQVRAGRRAHDLADGRKR